MRNNMVPNTDPWSTPLITGLQLDSSPSTLTLCFLPDNQFLTQFTTLYPIPWDFNLISNLWWAHPPLTGRIPDSTICPTRTLFNSRTNSRYLPMTSSDSSYLRRSSQHGTNCVRLITRSLCTLPTPLTVCIHASHHYSTFSCKYIMVTFSINKIM